MKILSNGGVGVYSDYRENVIVDADHPILRWKANKKGEKLRPGWFSDAVQREFQDGLPYISSENSEDVLTWNIFRSLQKEDKLYLLTYPLGINMDVEKVYFWQHDADLWSDKIDHDIQGVLNEIEPWGKDGKRQQTETDMIIRGNSYIIMVEDKLGERDKSIKAWCRSGSPDKKMRSEYLDYMNKHSLGLFNKSFEYERDGWRFYQLFRNYLLGDVLSRSWNVKFYLLAIVNGLNSNLYNHSHEEEFRLFQSILEDPSNTFILTWQQLWNILRDYENFYNLNMWLRKHPLLNLA